MDDHKHNIFSLNRNTTAALILSAVFLIMAMGFYGLSLGVEECRPNPNWSCLLAWFALTSFFAFIGAAFVTVFCYAGDDRG